MKVQAKCNTCGRNFLLVQIGPDSDTPGRCPFCGTRFARHYTGLLIESVEETEAAAARFVHALGRLQTMDTGFDIDVDGLLESVEESVRSAEPGRAAS